MRWNMNKGKDQRRQHTERIFFEFRPNRESVLSFRSNYIAKGFFFLNIRIFGYLRNDINAETGNWKSPGLVLSWTTARPPEIFPLPEHTTIGLMMDTRNHTWGYRECALARIKNSLPP